MTSGLRPLNELTQILLQNYEINREPQKIEEALNGTLAHLYVLDGAKREELIAKVSIQLNRMKTEKNKTILVKDGTTLEGVATHIKSLSISDKKSILVSLLTLVKKEIPPPTLENVEKLMSELVRQNWEEDTHRMRSVKVLLNTAGVNFDHFFPVSINSSLSLSHLVFCLYNLLSPFLDDLNLTLFFQLTNKLKTLAQSEKEFDLDVLKNLRNLERDTLFTREVEISDALAPLLGWTQEDLLGNELQDHLTHLENAVMEKNLLKLKALIDFYKTPPHSLINAYGLNQKPYAYHLLVIACVYNPLAPVLFFEAAQLTGDEEIAKMSQEFIRFRGLEKYVKPSKQLKEKGHKKEENPLRIKRVTKTGEDQKLSTLYQVLSTRSIFLKSLDYSSCLFCRDQPYFLELLAPLPAFGKLTALRFSICTGISTKEILGIIKKCPNLKRLDVKSTAFSPEEFQELTTSASHLTHFTYTHFSEESFSFFKELIELDLSPFPSLTAQKTSLICQTHPQVEELNLSGLRLKNGDLIECIRHLPKLKELNIENCIFLSSPILHALRYYCPQLKTLKASGTKITEKALMNYQTWQIPKPLPSPSTPSIPDIFEPGLCRDFPLKYLVNTCKVFPQLRVLNLSNLQVTDDQCIKIFTDAPNLKELYLNGCTLITEKIVTSLPKSLEVLEAQETQIPTERLSSMKAYRVSQSLRLHPLLLANGSGREGPVKGP
jgi:hypothetical protein